MSVSNLADLNAIAKPSDLNLYNVKFCRFVYCKKLSLIIYPKKKKLSLNYMVPNFAGPVNIFLHLVLTCFVCVFPNLYEYPCLTVKRPKQCTRAKIREDFECIRQSNG